MRHVKQIARSLNNAEDAPMDEAEKIKASILTEMEHQFPTNRHVK